jgi:hypothetical protein
MQDVFASGVYRELMTPDLAVGDIAHMFDLPRLDRAGERARLDELNHGRPVALVFGSYT